MKTFYSSDGSCVSVEGKYGKEFSVCGTPWRSAIYRTVKFEGPGNMCDERGKVRELSAYVRTT
jgi:hypothetical protein